jgi:hypothetical protein
LVAENTVVWATVMRNENGYIDVFFHLKYFS